MVKNKRCVLGILLLLIIGIVFISDCIKQEVGEEEKQKPETGIEQFQTGNTLLITQLQTRQSKELSDNRIGGTAETRHNKYWMYPGEVPRRSMGIRAPDDVNLGKLKWALSRVRSWELKVFLQAWCHRVGPNGWGKITAIPLTREPMERFLEQKKKKALILAEFAEEQGIELLDAWGPFFVSAKKEFSAYRELLPELRRIYSGEIALTPAYGTEEAEDDLSGFDYVLLFPGQARTGGDPGPSDYESGLHKQFDFYGHLRDEYGVKVLPVYLGQIDGLGGSFTSDESLGEFIDSFGSAEDVKIWLIELVFSEILARDVAAVDVHPLWFFQMMQTVHGVSKDFSYWPSKKPVNVAAKHLRHSWNREGKSALTMLQHAELAVNSILARSSDVELKRGASKLLKRSRRVYEKGKYASARSTSREILGISKEMESPLDIIVDGNGSEWERLDPVYFNPSRAFPWFNIVFCYGEERLKDVGNLKSVYAVNDPENLYLMLDFYGPLPQSFPMIDIDT